MDKNLDEMLNGILFKALTQLITELQLIQSECKDNKLTKDNIEIVLSEYSEYTQHIIYSFLDGILEQMKEIEKKRKN